jgi:hypothetical protein
MDHHRECLHGLELVPLVPYKSISFPIISAVKFTQNQCPYLLTYYAMKIIMVIKIIKRKYKWKIFSRFYRLPK